MKFILLEDSFFLYTFPSVRLFLFGEKYCIINKPTYGNTHNIHLFHLRCTDTSWIRQQDLVAMWHTSTKSDSGTHPFVYPFFIIAKLGIIIQHSSVSRVFYEINNLLCINFIVLFFTLSLASYHLTINQLECRKCLPSHPPSHDPVL